MPVKIPDHTSKLVPYKAGKPIEELAREKGIDRIVKLASNENPLGPAPSAKQAVADIWDEMHRYPDPAGFKMVSAFAERYGKKTTELICANGSDALIQYIVIALTNPGDKMLSSEGTFIGWYVNVNKLGRVPVNVPLKEYKFDLNAIVDAIRPDTAMIYLANPNNPTGTMFTEDEFVSFMKKVPSHIPVILDEAYTLFAKERQDYPDGLYYDYPNLFVLRTLSKDYGLAGLRLGLCFGPEALIRELYKVKLPFEPTLPAQAAAMAVLNDDGFLKKTADMNRESLERFRKAFDELGINYTDSAANFLLMLMPDEDTAADFNNECLNRGLILRHVASFGIPEGIRINSGTRDETDFAINVIKEVRELLKERF